MNEDIMISLYDFLTIIPDFRRLASVGILGDDGVSAGEDRMSVGDRRQWLVDEICRIYVAGGISGTAGTGDTTVCCGLAAEMAEPASELTMGNHESPGGVCSGYISLNKLVTCPIEDTPQGHPTLFVVREVGPEPTFTRISCCAG